MHVIDSHGFSPPHKFRSGKRLRPRARTRIAVERGALGGASAVPAGERQPLERRVIDAYYASERDVTPL